MRLYALIGTLVLLILPFAFITSTVGDNYRSTTYAGFLYYSNETDGSIDFLDSSESGTFQSDWLDDNGRYHSYFDPSYGLAMLVLILLLANIGISIVADDKKYSQVPAAILIICGVLLLFIRLTALSDNDISFYHREDVIFFGEWVYLEIPLALIWALIFAVLDFKKD